MRNDLITAIATALSPAAVSVIRLSGKGAAAAADKIFRAYSGASVPALPQRVLTAGRIESGAAQDEALCALFPEGKSFTGEESVEFHCHGGVALALAVVEELKKNGARQAEAGEFTKRAFLNGKLDLTKAEGIADLIEAECEAELRAGGNLLAGGLKDFCTERLDGLTAVLAELDAACDYPDEYDGESLRERTLDGLQNILTETETLLNSYNTGRMIKDGIQCVITGKVNTGKSSVLNALARSERAIVTPIPGTTRDLISETIVYKGFKIHLTDTAGIRKARTLPEKLGVERALNAAASADVVLDIRDVSQMKNDKGQGINEDNQRTAHSAQYTMKDRAKSRGEGQITNNEIKSDYQSQITDHRPPYKITLYNKCDLLSSALREKFSTFNFQLSTDHYPITTNHYPLLLVSAKTGENLDKLLDLILEKTAANEFTGGLILTTVRQRDAIKRAVDALKRAITAMTNPLLPLDVTYTDIKEAWAAFGNVTGTATPETIINALFSRFCVGK